MIGIVLAFLIGSLGTFTVMAFLLARKGRQYAAVLELVADMINAKDLHRATLLAADFAKRHGIGR